MEHFVARLAQYANGPLVPDQPTGRLRAIHRLLQVEQTADQPQRQVPRPLGELLGYLPISIDDQQVLAKATPRTPPGTPPEPPTLKEIQQVLWPTVQRQVKRQAGIESSSYTIQDVCGKMDKGFLRGPHSVTFDIGQDIWRLADFLRPHVIPLGTIDDLSLLTPVPKEGLGDGIVAVVRPELLGLSPSTIEYFQVRVLVRHAQDQRVTRVFKGLLMVHPAAHDVVAWEDGYGQPEQQGSFEVYQMVCGTNFKPKSRYTLQGLYYQGVPNWAEYLFSQENVLHSIDDEGHLLEERLIAADAPIRALGGQGLQILMSRVTRLTVYGGRARMGLPAIAFKYITGLEYIAEMEETRDRFDNDTAFDSAMSQAGAMLPPFLAPRSLKGYFDLNGGINTEWVLNRLPDLVTGQCAIRHTLSGYQPFNAMVVPSWSLQLAGNDFDGDIIKVVPPTERGGLYIAFNDMPLIEQQHRLKRATTNRSAGKGTHLYDHGLARWAGQLQSTLVLGASDKRARRALDKGEREYAYSFQPWTQCSVDRQKRPIPWPHPDGPKRMPSVKPDRKGITFATDVLSDITKGTKGDRSMPRIERDWANFDSKLDALQEANALYAMVQAGRDPMHAYGGHQNMRLIAAWAKVVHERMSRAYRQVPRYRPVNSNRHWPLPHVIDYPNRQLQDELPEVPRQLLGTLKFLDQGWDLAYGAGGDTRQGLYNIKDALLDVGKGLNICAQLADHATTFRVFRVFASAPQLRAYFEPLTTLRVSDLFPYFREEEAFGTCYWKHDAIHITNSQPIYIGMTKLNTGDLTFRRHHLTGQFYLDYQGTEHPLPAANLTEAMLHARAVLNRSWLDHVSPPMPELPTVPAEATEA